MELKDIIQIGPRNRIFTIGVFNKDKPSVAAWNDEFDIRLPESALKGIVEGLVEFLADNDQLWTVTKTGTIRFTKALPEQYSPAMRELGRKFLQSTLMDHRDEWKVIFRTVERQLGKQGLNLMFPATEDDPEAQTFSHNERPQYFKPMSRDERRRYIALELLVDLYKDKQIRKQVSRILKQERGREFFDKRTGELEAKLDNHMNRRHLYR